MKRSNYGFDNIPEERIFSGKTYAILIMVLILLIAFVLKVI